MAQSEIAASPERLLLLGRAWVEAQRFESEDRQALTDAWRPMAATLESSVRAGARQALEAITARPTAPKAATAEAPVVLGSGDAVRQKAALELKLQTESQRSVELEKQLAAAREEFRQATDSLGVQQKKLREMGEERSKLLAEIARQENLVRVSQNETEQAKLQIEKLKSSRQLVGDQATQAAEQINALKAENETLRIRVEAALQERDARAHKAAAEVQAAEGQTADTAFGALWARMRAEIPEVFVETHVPTQRTFEQLCDAVVEFVRVCAVMELHVQHMLRDLRQVTEKNDRLAHFYMLFTKSAGLVDTMREQLVSGRKSMNLANLLRAHQAWARAFGSGLYKVIVRSPVIIGDEMNPKNWPIKKGFTQSEEAALGSYYKETAQKELPEKLGTALRKHAGDMAYDDYNALMKRTR
ncbi:MAG: hypothetical protein U1D55_15050 [Phycisphaerae bacterium]